MPLKTFPFDAAKYLDSDEAIGFYLDEAFKTQDPTFITHAIGVAARARGMTQIAKDAGLSRKSLYKALSDAGNPAFATVLRALQALGLRMRMRAERVG